MKRKIVIGSIFATIILLSQLVIVSPVVADEVNNTVIKLSPAQKIKLENAIAGFENTEFPECSDLHEELVEIYEENTNENDEIEITAIFEFIDAVDNFIHNSDPSIISLFALSLNEVIEFIIMFAIECVLLIPLEMVALIFDDIVNLWNYYMICMQEPDFLLAVTIAVFLPDLYDVLVKLEVLKDYSVDRPDTPEEKKQYFKEKFYEAVGDAFEAFVISSGTVIGMYYLYPKMGYLSRMGTDLALLCKSAKELVNDGKIKMEHFRNIFIDVPKAFVDFVDPRDGQPIVDFLALISEIEEAQQHAEAWYNELYYNGSELVFDVAILVGSLTDLVVYYTSEDEQPWLRPIEVIVQVWQLEIGEVVHVSFKDQSQTDTSVVDGYNRQTSIFYQTNITSNPYGLHEIVVVAEKNGVTKEVTCSAFSAGAIKIEPNFEKSKNSIRNPFLNLKSKMASLLGIFQNLLLKIFELINGTPTGQPSL